MTGRPQTYLKEDVRIDGQGLIVADLLDVAAAHLDMEFAVEEMELLWAEFGGLPPGTDHRVRSAAITEQVEQLERVIEYGDHCRDCGDWMAVATPSVPEPNWLEGGAASYLDILDASSVEERLSDSKYRVEASLIAMSTLSSLHDCHPIVKCLMKAVENRDVTGYSEAYSRLVQIEQIRADQEVVARIETVINEFIPGLVASVSNLLDDSWGERFSAFDASWRWASVDNWLRKRTDFAYQATVWKSRCDTEEQIGRLLAESASLRAWTHFFNRLSPHEAAALKSWREAVRAMGKGTGRSARMERLRREAREYMDQCRKAIPVWIMPRYLVAEMADPAPGHYDIVIVDEASQLGIESLFLFFVAKKMVVVGDDQQISPYGIGIPDEAIAALQKLYLEDISHRHALSPQSSLYGNARIRFGANIVLREHFRCMPEIIQFSNDLCYASNGTPLDPLRAYSADRLQPLVVRHVPTGYRTGGPSNAVNEPEADAIVAQILACIEDPRYGPDGTGNVKTMGVISLQGEAQAKLIERKILGCIEPEVIEERRLICGDAYAFQGDERHTIFLSMVAAPNERIGTLSTDSARQRFNVAASRAQDQLWLFHTATLDTLSPRCMRYRLLSYMLAPEREITSADEQKFDSKFEREVFDMLSSRGYHVRTQVCVGDPTNHRYRIDLVVEGMQGRLAVECDGDEWHGPDRYEQDTARQRDLERAGWQFERIRGGDFYRDRKQAMEPVWAELERLGIRPGGIDSFSDRWHQIALNLADASLEYHRILDDPPPLLLSFVLKEEALSSHEDVQRFLDTVTQIDWGMEGFYLIVSTDESSYNQQFDTQRLAQLLYLVYVLGEINGLRVVCGYSDFVGILLRSVGAEAFATGWSQSLRQFHQKNFLKRPPGGQPPRERYSSGPLFNSILLGELQDIHEVGHLADVLSGVPLDHVITVAPSPQASDWTRPISQRHHWQTLQQLDQVLAGDVNADLRAILQRIRDARGLYTMLEATGAQFSRYTGKDHLVEWVRGIRSFCDEAGLNSS